MIHTQYDRITEPIREKIHSHGNQEHDIHTLSATKGSPNCHHDNGQQRHQENCFQTVHHYRSPLFLKRYCGKNIP